MNTLWNRTLFLHHVVTQKNLNQNEDKDILLLDYYQNFPMKSIPKGKRFCLKWQKYHEGGLNKWFWKKIMFLWKSKRFMVIIRKEQLQLKKLFSSHYRNSSCLEWKCNNYEKIVLLEINIFISKMGILIRTFWSKLDCSCCSLCCRITNLVLLIKTIFQIYAKQNERDRDEECTNIFILVHPNLGLRPIPSLKMRFTLTQLVHNHWISQPC